VACKSLAAFLSLISCVPGVLRISRSAPSACDKFQLQWQYKEDDLLTIENLCEAQSDIEALLWSLGQLGVPNCACWNSLSVVVTMFSI
jgi:hypothetical protein